MRAITLFSVGENPVLTEVPDPEPGPGEVLVAMRACGICGSDVHIVEGTTRTAKLPIVLGHEASGVVAALGHEADGASAAALAVGDRVTVNPMITCGTCRLCTTGRQNYCPSIRILGLHVDGAHAELLAVPAGNLVRLPDEIGFPLGAIVADAIATPLRAILSANVERGTTVAVFGLGGLGLHAAMLLDQIFGAEVIGVDVGDAQLERAASFGIRTVVDGRYPRVSDEIKRITGEGVTASFEFVGAVGVVEQAVRSLAHNGTCAVVGVGRDRLQLSLRQETLVARGQRIIGSHGYLTEDIRQLLDWIRAGKLRLGNSVSHQFPLADYASGLDTLRDRSANAIRVAITNEEKG
jgi:alcohol dehydrogenase, propanol-preferring